MSIEFIKSEKGKDLLVYESFVYRNERTTEAKTIWKCEEYYKIGNCKARIHLSLDNQRILKQIGEHNHVPEKAKIEARKILRKIKEVAISTQTETNNIIAQASVNVTQSTIAQLPSPIRIKRTIQRIRIQKEKAPSLPRSLNELIIPGEYQLTKRGQQFMLFDSQDTERIIIFSTSNNLKLLKEGDNWYADGTFKTVPKLFNQLYTIHGLKENTVIPLVYILMESRTQNIYEKVFETLKNFGPFNPKTILTDFEFAALNAFKKSFPNANQRGCFFHFSQCIWRKIQTPECQLIQEKYKSDGEFALNIKMLAALAFIPIEDVAETFDELLETEFYEENQELLKPLIDYFEDNWIGRTQRRRRRAPTFEIELWNCFLSTLDGLPKTNNSCEGWHRSFSSLLGASHPTIWKFIDGIKLEQSLNEMKIEQYLAGDDPPPPRKKYKDCSERILKKVQNYQNHDKISHLRGIAHNLTLNV